MAVVKSVWRYPGAKGRLISSLEAYLDNILKDSNEFADCFVGGGSVLLHVANKYPQINLYANDKNYNVYAYWKIVSDTDNYNLLQLNSLLDIQPTTELFYSLKKEITTDLVRSAYIGIFLNRCSFSGMSVNPIGGKDQKSKYTVGCRFNSKKLQLNNIKIHNLLQGRVIVDNCDINNYYVLDKQQISLYLDPPYRKVGADLYHMFMDDKEHTNLSLKLNGRTNWLLSYDDDSFIKDLYKENQMIDLAARYSINGKKTKWENKSELLIFGYKK